MILKHILIFKWDDGKMKKKKKEKNFLISFILFKRLTRKKKHQFL